ncbi:MAG: hypothetical protein MJZ19_03965 [Paludibacteraceae bacterium]|nr:hypothetical protein [Paludibacteraceae bacterium]
MRNWTNKIEPSIINYTIWIVVTIALWLTLPQTIALTSEDETAGSVLSQVLYYVNFGESFRDYANLIGALLISYLLFIINEKFSLIRVRTLLPTITGAFFLTLFTTHDMASAGGIHALILLIAVILALAYVDNRSELISFNIGALIALGSINFPLFILYAVPIASFFRFCNAFSVRTLLSLIIGYLVTLLYSIPILLYIGIDFSTIATPVLQLVSLDGYYDLSIIEKIYSLFVLLLSIYSLFRLSIFFTHESVRQRGMFTLLFAVFFISILFVVIFKDGIGYALHTVTAFGALFLGCMLSALFDKDLISRWIAIILAVINAAFVIMQYIE